MYRWNGRTPTRAYLVSALLNDEPIDLAYDFDYKPFGPRTEMTLGNSLADLRTFDTRYQPYTWGLVDQSIGLPPENWSI